jgi:hypothetical protein
LTQIAAVPYDENSAVRHRGPFVEALSFGAFGLSLADAEMAPGGKFPAGSGLLLCALPTFIVFLA